MLYCTAYFCFWARSPYWSTWAKGKNPWGGSPGLRWLNEYVKAVGIAVLLFWATSPTGSTWAKRDNLWGGPPGSSRLISGRARVPEALELSVTTLGNFLLKESADRAHLKNDDEKSSQGRLLLISLMLKSAGRAHVRIDAIWCTPSAPLLILKRIIWHPVGQKSSSL